MTLVVARRFADGPRLVCDSQLTEADNRTPNPYDQGALKAVVLHRGLCVAFDGGEITGCEAVLDAGRRAANDFDLSEVCRGLRRASKRLPNDFVVACLSPTPSLVRISNGKEGHDENAWLGSRRAFAAYQRHFHGVASLERQLQLSHHPRLTPEELAASSRMGPSLMQVIEDQGFEEVGGLPIHVAPTKAGFGYESFAMLSADHEQTIDAKDGWVEADWGTAVEGGFGYAVKTPDTAGIGAVGAYFPHGRLGVLYYPGRFLRAIRFPDVSDDQFCKAVETRFGFPFGHKGMRFGGSGGGDALQATT